MKRFLLMLCLVVCGLTACSSDTAPDVTFTKLDGTTFKLSDLKGDVVLVKFWATSCSTCIAQMPDTVRDYDKYHLNGYRVVAVAMSYDPLMYVRNYTDSTKLPFIVTTDTDGDNAKAFGGVRFTPVSFLIDRHGKIVKSYVGGYDHDKFIKTLEKTLGES